ncbi:hypothetical protein VTL71DRAFT_7300 [Oculimacula yallundae]|uniref:Spindle pole body component n=1 Tax=Oculimacula yallundae TaxID=86028 RepID=A0ABR4BX55_9HELO
MNDERGDPGDVFAIPDLWAPSRFLRDGPDNSLLFSQLRFVDIDEALPEIVQQFLHKEDNGFFSIPDLLFGVSEPLPPPVNSPHILNEASFTHEERTSDEHDIWILPEEIPIKSANYQTWEGFEKQKDEVHCTPYLAEAGPSILDTVIASREDSLHIKNTEHAVVDSKIYASSLLSLGLGRSSVFFTWDESKQAFIPAISLMRISGYTGDSLDGLSSMFLDCGNITRSLQSFVEKAYAREKSPGRIALADAVSTLLATIQSRLSVSAAGYSSILQLQALFRPAHSMLTCFQRIVVNTSVTRSDESMLSTIFEEIQLLEHRTDSLRDILLEILSRVSQPWLEFASEWLGLQREAGLPLTKDGPGKSFVRIDNKEWVDDQGMEMNAPDYVLDYDKVPAFIAPEDARALFEVGKSLRFLRSHHPEHPLSRSDVVTSANPPSLEWKFSWQEIVQVESKALQYEQDLIKALQQFSPDTSSALLASVESNFFTLDFFGKPESDMQAHVLASIESLNQPLAGDDHKDYFSSALNSYLNSGQSAQSQDDESVFAPPISLAPVLSFNPMIAAQARVVNGTCMRMFFNSHQVREHLSIQRSFQLLGNGVFSSRLSHALFDPELESAERQRGVARSGGVMGLRLGGRDTWPPASSELRLALMGVLTDSYTSSQPLNKSRAGTYLDQSSIPGDLSFSVRDMTPEEIEKCMNPDSVEALDFLRLSYKPPQPLEAVITPMILFKYDQLFKLLLRVVRMLYVVSALFQDTTDRSSSWQGAEHIAQRFRIEAHHFVSSISGYFFDTGIESTWRIFDRKLDQIEERLKIDGDYVILGQNEGLDKLRDYHERVLDRIMFALLLRKRQQPVMNLLEEIFTLILQFSKHSRERALQPQQESANADFKSLYLRFRKKVGVFITVCRGLSEKKGYGERKMADSRSAEQEGLFDGNDLAEENTIVQLLTKLEMSNYYSRSVDM